jgi:hypothetical protein
MGGQDKYREAVVLTVKVAEEMGQGLQESWV